MWTFILFSAKNYGFFEICGVSAWTRGIELLQTRGEEGQFFTILCRRLLWMAPNVCLAYHF